MPAVAQGINKRVVFAKQSALGSPATTGGQIMRRTSAVFAEARETYENNEIVSHQQSTGATAGVRRTTGRLDGLLSPGTYSGLLASLLRKDQAATPAITGLSITVAGSGPTYTVTRASGDFLTGGVKIGDVVRLTAGSFDAANLNKNLLVIGVTSTVLTVIPLNGSTLTAEGPIASATVTVRGKKTWAPASSHTNDYYTVEEVYSDLTRFEQFKDCKIASAEVGIPATGNSTISFDVPGLSKSRSGSATIGSPSAETTSDVLTAVNGVIVVNGVITPVTGGSITISGNIAPGEAEVGSNSISDMIRGRIAVSGTITAKFSGVTLQDIYDAQSDVVIIFTLATSGLADAEFMTFTMPKVRLFGDAPTDGENVEIVRTYPFTAAYNGAGGASLASHQTILQIHDSLAA